ncbi:hypothetical protein CYLTODRAFT_457416 [Cylindrobasidium torrendii FP15055 ss-10]|uniref:Uncharacterized protein n=1 Tax=Cylindrobasidium torrendii FP15055 ss-10 TaxID=1314674 RepID=A0A0D7B209_9AGAR|nr:hypothetical protein CYLTODRAFT_457416 [Cylindrobasidium torrendii FP15055 ss-10]
MSSLLPQWGLPPAPKVIPRPSDATREIKPEQALQHGYVMRGLPFPHGFPLGTSFPGTYPVPIDRSFLAGSHALNFTANLAPGYPGPPSYPPDEPVEPDASMFKLKRINGHDPGTPVALIGRSVVVTSTDGVTRGSSSTTAAAVRGGNVKASESSLSTALGGFTDRNGAQRADATPPPDEGASATDPASPSSPSDRPSFISHPAPWLSSSVGIAPAGPRPSRQAKPVIRRPPTPPELQALQMAPPMIDLSKRHEYQPKRARSPSDGGDGKKSRKKGASARPTFHVFDKAAEDEAEEGAETTEAEALPIVKKPEPLFADPTLESLSGSPPPNDSRLKLCPSRPKMAPLLKRQKAYPSTRVEEQRALFSNKQAAQTLLRDALLRHLQHNHRMKKSEAADLIDKADHELEDGGEPEPPSEAGELTPKQEPIENEPQKMVDDPAAKTRTSPSQGGSVDEKPPPTPIAQDH